MDTGTVKLVSIEEEMKSSYLDYAMSVIVSRALPDVFDGLKPVQRRILYAMSGLGLHHTSPYKKSARIVGEVLGKYHPHGDAPVYEAMVRMAQDFTFRYPLIEGQGNFGSMDNDPPAAMRYTEARLSRIAEEMLVDIDKDTVDFLPNFDGSLKEPAFLPARLPNLLVNGASGIAVGMTTNIPPHNLTEVCDAIAFLIENPEATVEELLRFIKGPDFPTGGVIFGGSEIMGAYATGQGKVVIRARVFEETSRAGRCQIIVTELPYQTNKAALVEKIAELAKERKIEGISEIRDESDRQGMRLMIELKKEAQPQQVINNLYKYTPMQSTYFINMLALIKGQPRVINLKEALSYYIDYRREIITRRSRFELEKAKEKAHILEGFRLALDNLDKVIPIIRKAETVESARNNLMKSFPLSLSQAQAILDMQLRRLARLERQKLIDEHTETLKVIASLEDLLANPRKILFLIKEEVSNLKSKYGDARRTLISEENVFEFRDEDLIPHQKVMVMLSKQGYIKRVPYDVYRAQHRGGRGITSMTIREIDEIRHCVVADTHACLLFFTNRGKVYRLKCYEIPQDSSRLSKGIALISLLSIDPSESVTALVVVKDFDPDAFLILVTSRGMIKKISLAEFASVRSNGLIAMRLASGEELVAARKLTMMEDVLLVTQNGQAIRFSVKGLRSASRTSGGVRGIRLRADDLVVGMDIVSRKAHLLTVTENGFGKLSLVEDYRLQSRGGAGVRAHRVTPKTGKVIAARLVPLSEHLLIISAKGIVIRIPVDEEIPLQSRSTQGVRLKKLDVGDKVVSMAY